MIEIIIILISGIGAGMVTGLVGASAVIIVVPLFVILLNYPAYLAIGIALSIDVFASFTAALIYYKHGKIKIKSNLILLAASLLLAVMVGSYFSKDIPSGYLELMSGVGVIFAGISMMTKKKKQISTAKRHFFERHRNSYLILLGLLIGFIAGVFGAGGGLMILLALIVILDYKTHEAVGTSVFLMIFIALLGGATHYYNAPFSILFLGIGAIGGIIGAIFASEIANSLDEKVLTRLVGIIVLIFGISLIFKNLLAM